LPDPADFSHQIEALTGMDGIDAATIESAGRNITGLERMINARLGLRASDDTLPQRWFNEPNEYGQFKGERIDRKQFEATKQRFYAITGLDQEGMPRPDWHRKLAGVVTGFALEVQLPPDTPGAPDQRIIVDQPVADLAALRSALARRLPEAREQLDDRSLNLAVNDEMVLFSEKSTVLHNGDRVAVVPALAGG
jgi:aldehyde:ferredoxin oxidoreductase